MTSQKITTIPIDDPRYPAELKAIGADAPRTLYALGNLDLLDCDKRVAVIGARQADRKGYDAAYRLGKQYAAEGYIIVSGLALGCDTAAHRGCLDAKGLTIAVVATGLNLTHPAENSRLQSDILAGGGLLLSEQPLNTPHSPQRLVARNRLQAALSRQVIVAQCPERSGTLHTVRFAHKYGKEVLAVDFGYSNPANAGNCKLIESGQAEGIKLK